MYVYIIYLYNSNLLLFIEILPTIEITMLVINKHYYENYLCLFIKREIYIYILKHNRCYMLYHLDVFISIKFCSLPYGKGIIKLLFCEKLTGLFLFLIQLQFTFLTYTEAQSGIRQLVSYYTMSLR